MKMNRTLFYILLLVGGYVLAAAVANSINRARTEEFHQKSLVSPWLESFWLTLASPGAVLRILTKKDPVG
jgi:hypothetical protein